LLVEPLQPGPKSRIIAINTHPDHNNNFEYFIGRELAARRVPGPGDQLLRARETIEEFLPAVAAAVRYARTVPGVEKVVFATHSGGGPVLTFYEEIGGKRSVSVSGALATLPIAAAATSPVCESGRLLLLDINTVLRTA